MNLNYRKAKPGDFDRCAEIRGLTRDNPISGKTLVAIGVTKESWTPKLQSGVFQGFVAEDQESVVGFCFGDIQTGEVLVLAVLSSHEGIGVGKKLLSLTVNKLQSAGCSMLWLAASPNPKIRAYGFYRRLGW